MLIDLVNATEKDIALSVQRSIESDNTRVMYLQNNGTPNHVWNLEDMKAWINDDVEE